MATAFALVHCFFLLLSFTALLTLTTTTAAAATARPQRLIMKLIHSDSVLSPYYNPNATISERAERAMKSSMARLAYLQATTKRASFATNDVRAGLTPDDIGLGFLANFSIGRPPIPQLTAIDTGSSLSWVQCVPCTNCFNQSIPFFDPSKSSTYVNLPCNSIYCVESSSAKCDDNNHCTYSESYVGGQVASGNLASEEFIFETSDEGIVAVPDVVFGCGHASTGFTDNQLSGILGLDTTVTSWANQLGYKFSYCIGNISDPNYSYNQLILGDGAKLEGTSTPFDPFIGRYYLTLEGISVGEKKLDIDPETFKRTPSGHGGVVLDSGSTLTWLVRGGFNPLTDEVQSLFKGVLERVFDKANPTLLCYKGSKTRDLVGFPVVAFHFAGGTDLELDAGSMFYQENADVLCMAVDDSDNMGLSIIGGVMAQQFYNVGYDLGGNNVFFQRIDCELLDE